MFKCQGTDKHQLLFEDMHKMTNLEMTSYLTYSITSNINNTTSSNSVLN